MNLYGGMFLSQPPQPMRAPYRAIFELWPDFIGFRADNTRNAGIPNPSPPLGAELSDRVDTDPDQEGRPAEQEHEGSNLPAERAHADSVHLPLSDGIIAGNAPEDTQTITEEQGGQRSYPRSTSADTSSLRTRDPQDEVQSRLPSMLERGEDSSGLIGPQASSAAQANSEGQISDCYRCDRPNSWENMVACDSNHSPERWFHMSCAGLTTLTVLSSDETWLCEDCSKSKTIDENDETSYQDDREPSTDKGDQVDPSQNYKGKQNQDPKITKSTSLTKSYDSNDGDDNISSNNTHKRKRAQGLELKHHSAVSEIDENEDEWKLKTDESEGDTYFGNGRKRRRQQQRRTRQSSEAPAGSAPAHNPAMTSGLIVPNSASITTLAQAAPSGMRRQGQDRFDRETADKIRDIMDDVIKEKQLTEKKFQTISDRMFARHGISVTPGSIKNYWNRSGREYYNLDERRKPNPKKMVTGVQSPEDRRKARQMAKTNG
ncbi:hypothetical protein MMC07_009039 [Pseudocyphellaria aurata]|nr:hypothetical protein [Pseudocyphellaria aurata]